MDGGVVDPKDLRDGRSNASETGFFAIENLLEEADAPLLELLASAAYVASAGYGYRTINGPETTGFSAIMGRKPYEDIRDGIISAALVEIRHLADPRPSALSHRPFREAVDRLIEAARNACKESGLDDSRYTEALRIPAATHQSLCAAVDDAAGFLPPDLRAKVWNGGLGTAKTARPSSSQAAKPAGGEFAR